MMAPALGLPDLTKPFELFVHERQHLALGVLAQRLGSWKRPAGYFSKQLDTMSKGWPGCLHAVAATVLLIQEARKLTMGQKIVVYVPHMVITVLERKGGHWLSPSRMLKYQVALLEQDDVELKATAIVNPAMFPSTENPTEKLEHDCLVTIEQVYSSRPDLKDEPLKDPDLELFTDGSSFVQEGRRIAGYAVVTIDKTCVMAVEKLSKKLSREFQQLKEDMSYSPPVQTSISAIRSKHSSAQERGYSGYTLQATLWFYLHDHGEDMRKWDGKIYLDPRGTST
ncbi:hypothetical protein GRJ2_003314200 [Grus japonensis]|uniref:Reverse transcriptase RNase H-like domain-containing protein n=1 Tax=Grus japonensis TaxID=30415 RepID=A0ABC9YGR5_GRUJA